MTGFRLPLPAPNNIPAGGTVYGLLSYVTRVRLPPGVPNSRGRGNDRQQIVDALARCARATIERQLTCYPPGSKSRRRHRP